VQQVGWSYGYRARIGLIYMHSSIVMEPEFYSMAPDGVTIHTTRIILPRATVEGVLSMAESREVEAATRLLAAAPVHVILFGGTSASFIKGLGWDQQIITRMAAVSGGTPATTTSTASVNALRALNIETLAIATPYIDEVNEFCRGFFTENGFNVANIRGLGLERDHDIGNTSDETVYRLVKEVDCPQADAIFISCTNLRTIGVIRALEQDLRKPVVSAIQASFWECARLAGVTLQDDAFGTLLRCDAVSGSGTKRTDARPMGGVTQR
jgi:maleate isomerase